MATAADGISAALAQPNELEACRRFCTEVLNASRRWGPPEQRLLFEQLPVVLNRLYAWLGLPGVGVEEAILRTFHPTGPLPSHLSVWKAPSFIFPLRRLPPRALRAAVLASTDWPGARAVPGVVYRADHGSPWFSLLGPSRLARSPAGGLEGVTMTAQEFVLASLIHYLTCDPSQWPRPPALPGRFGSMSAFGGGLGGPPGAAGGAFGAPGGGAGGMGGGFGGGFGSSSSAMQPAIGNISITFERLLLAYLQSLLPHSVYEVAPAQEPRASRFLLFLLHEFLLAPQPQADALPPDLVSNSVRLDGRARPGALHATRLLALHVLANPALQRGCEQALGAADGGLGVAAGTTMAHFGSHDVGSTARLTREVALLMPPLVELIVEMLGGPPLGKPFLLETLTSLMRLWLVLLQPWKAPRLYNFYLISRSANPRYDPSELSSGVGSQAGNGFIAGSQSGGQVMGSGWGARQGTSGRCVDVALLGLEPEAASFGPQQMQAPNLALAPEGSGLTRSVSSLANLMPGSLEYANAIPLVPGSGNAQTWRSYVTMFQGAYCLLEAFLVTPTHRELCLLLCKRLADNRSTNDIIGARRHIVVAMRVLAQALLCFTDPSLLQVLAELPASRQSSSAERAIIIENVLRPETVAVVSLTWAALLAFHKDFRDYQNEINPLLCAISRQFGSTPLWQAHGIPPVTEATTHRVFAQKVLSESSAAQPASSEAVPGAAAAAVAAEGPQFRGSEWQRPKRGGEVEFLLLFTYWLAMLIDRMLGRQLMSVAWSASNAGWWWGPVPQTEWPRLFANWKLSVTSGFVLLWAVLR